MKSVIYYIYASLIYPQTILLFIPRMNKITLSYEEIAFIMSVTSKYPLIPELRHVTMFLGSKFPLNKDIDIDPEEYKEIKNAILK